MRIKLIGVNGRYTHSTLSLFYLRQVLAAHLPTARISLHQYTINDNYFATVSRIFDKQPEVICFSVYIWNSERVAHLLMDLYQILPQTIFIIGGPEARAMTRQHELPRVTLVEGEVEGLPEQFFRDLGCGAMAGHYACAANPSFELPYDDEDFQTHLAHRHIYYESSRGCPFQCAYCLSAGSRGVRHLELAQVKDELRRILAHNPHTVRFIDRTFNAIDQRALAIWEFLLSLSVSTCFHFEVAPDRFTEEMFTLLRRAPVGRFQFEIGLQSTNPAALTAVNRQTDSRLALATIQRLAAMNTIHIHADLILGLPKEDEKSFAAGVSDLFAARPHYIQMGLLKVLPDTPLDCEAQKLQLIHRQRPPYELLATPTIAAPRLQHLYWLGETIEKLYNCHFFKPLFHYLAEQQEPGFSFFERLLPLCRKYDFFKRAATQDLMSTILAEHGKTRPDRPLFIEILQYCWLASGHKKLPSHLPDMDLKAHRDHLFATLPKEIPGLYQRKERNHFFRKTVFGRFSASVMTLVGEEGKGGYLAFLTERERRTIIKQVRVVRLGETKTEGHLEGEATGRQTDGPSPCSDQ